MLEATFIDKKGKEFSVRELKEKDIPSLLDMYRSFRPKGRFQGMPPLEMERCRTWINELVRNGINLIALRGDRIIGHAVLLPDEIKKDAEYMIFVAQDSRNMGVGSCLTKTALDITKKLGIKKLWLSVGAYNFIAIRLYRKFGFDFADKENNQEKVMVLFP